MNDDIELRNLLVKIGTSNEMYEFPLGEIDNDYTHLYLNQQHFEVLWLGIVKFLREKYSNIVSHTFVLVSSKYFAEEDEVSKMDEMDYFANLDSLYDNLKKCFICIVPKDSEDGELMKEINFKK